VLTFTIDHNNYITALTTTPQTQVSPEAARFSGARERDRLAKHWSGPRLVEICNALPDQKPVKKSPATDSVAQFDRLAEVRYGSIR
jgi:hypothetical protein